MVQSASYAGWRSTWGVRKRRWYATLRRSYGSREPGTRRQTALLRLQEVYPCSLGAGMYASR